MTLDEFVKNAEKKTKEGMKPYILDAELSAAGEQIRRKKEEYLESLRPKLSPKGEENRDMVRKLFEENTLFIAVCGEYGTIMINPRNIRIDGIRHANGLNISNFPLRSYIETVEARFYEEITEIKVIPTLYGE